MKNALVEVNTCIDCLELAKYDVNYAIPEEVTDSIMYYLKEYNRLYLLDSWKYGEDMGR